MLLEHPLAEHSQAEGADKVLRVELEVHGRDAAADDGLAAAPAQHALAGVVVQRAEGPAVQFQEAAAGEGLQAVL